MNRGTKLQTSVPSMDGVDRESPALQTRSIKKQLANMNK